MEKDDVFSRAISKTADFKFGEQVATVFDDMVSRSVPFYGEMQRMIAELSEDYAKPGSLVYDLGCSTGTTLIAIHKTVHPDIAFIGIDDSKEMLNKCRTKLIADGISRTIELRCEDLAHQASISNASVVILCLTLQFVRPIYREQLIQKIASGLNSGGALLLVEKIIGEDTVINRDFITYYYNYKRRNHYSDLEISQKREALENVLIPYKLSENIAALYDSGFSACEVFFKWYNFAGILAVKK